MRAQATDNPRDGIHELTPFRALIRAGVQQLAGGLLELNQGRFHQMRPNAQAAVLG